MNHCLYCYEPIEQKVSWGQFLGIQKNNVLCLRCDSGLMKIQGQICERCGRPFNGNDLLCTDCHRWEKQEQWKGLLSKNRSIYLYNDHLKEMIYRFKYRGDAELAKIFASPIRTIYEKYFANHIIIPIPLSNERKYERGFNQAELIAYNIGKPILALSRMAHEEKQSKKGREERLKLQSSPIFVIEKTFKQFVENSDIIVVDDIYTTGATIVQAAKALKLAGAKSISSITIAR